MLQFAHVCVFCFSHVSPCLCACMCLVSLCACMCLVSLCARMCLPSLCVRMCLLSLCVRMCLPSSCVRMCLPSLCVRMCLPSSCVRMCLLAFFVCSHVSALLCARMCLHCCVLACVFLFLVLCTITLKHMTIFCHIRQVVWGNGVKRSTIPVSVKNGEERRSSHPLHSRTSNTSFLSTAGFCVGFVASAGQRSVPCAST
jgi:hypothetical protein